MFGALSIVLTMATLAVMAHVLYWQPKTNVPTPFSSRGKQLPWGIRRGLILMDMADGIRGLLPAVSGPVRPVQVVAAVQPKSQPELLPIFAMAETTSLTGFDARI